MDVQHKGSNNELKTSHRMILQNTILYALKHKTTSVSTHKGHTMRALFAFLLLAASTADACINIEGVTIDGKYRQVLAIGQEDEHPELQEILRAEPSSRLVELTGATDEEHADAVRDIFSGDYSAAIEKLEAIESSRPGDYRTAANLGTAYELAGDNEKALHWISEGIRRNEYSHDRSEWLHKKILETKIAMESDPGFLNKNHIILISDVAEGATDFTYEYDGKTYLSYDLARALHYQLSERMLFVKPTDPVVADLLYCLAILEANTRTLEPAVEFLQLAKEYGYHDTTDIDARIARYQQIIDSTWKVTDGDIIEFVVGLVFYGLLFLAVALIVRMILRRIRARRERATQ